MHFYHAYCISIEHTSSGFCISESASVNVRSMIRCHLSRLMGERRVRLVDVARATKISRNMLAKLYYDRAKRLELGDLTKLCKYFQCTVSDLLEFVDEGRATVRRRDR